MSEAVFSLQSEHQPTGDQPEAIAQLVSNIQAGVPAQVLLGVTGSGKTFTMSNVIARCNRPALVLAPLSLATGYAVLRALRIGSRAALAAGLMWAIMPFVLFYVPDWDNGVFSSAIGLPSFQMSFRHYNTLIGAGYNAMSDTLSTLLVLVTLLAALRVHGNAPAIHAGRYRFQAGMSLAEIVEKAK